MFGHDHPNFSPCTGDTDLKQALQSWENCKKFAKFASDAQKQKRTDKTYKYPKFQPGDNILVVYDQTKNGRHLRVSVISDAGGAELTAQLNNRSRPLKIHKGMIFLEKGTTEYNSVFNTKHHICPRKQDAPTQQKTHYNLRSSQKHASD